MKKRRTSCLGIFSILIFIGVCVAVAGIGWLALTLPDRAKQTFGPYDPNLQPSQRILLSARLLLNSSDLIYPGNVYGSEQSFDIGLGESTYAISQRLQSEGLITNAQAFRDYLVYSGLDTSLQAGEYQLSPRMTPLEIAQALQDATPSEVSFNIIPGWRLEEIAAALPTSGLEITPEAFLQAAQSPPPGVDWLNALPAHATLEGFLFPDSYRLPRDLDVRGLIASILSNFESKVDSEILGGFERQGLTLYQAVTLASIVEREAVVDEEMPLIASVFLNRLNAGMKLDSDPTVQYAIGYNAGRGGWWTNPLSLEDLQTNSPYNTYVYDGLPPGPIANPSLQALRAVAFPAKTPYYYFRATCDDSGKHIFSETFQEHVESGCQ
ncbi:MAG: endolytic transglycosylase MltG [Anaerolineales bacterium]|jgi:UPF0755 protein